MTLQRSRTGLRPTVLFAAGLAATVLLIAFQALHLWTFDLRVPLTYSEGDVVVILMYIKGLLQDGWPTTISHLSAPFTYPGAAFPMLTSTDWLIIKIMSVFTTEPGRLLNSFWLLTLVLSAWSAGYASYQLGLSRALSFASGILFAFLPFALIRNVHHLNLVYYPVPLLCLLAVVIAGEGNGVRNVRQATLVGLAACVIQGFDYIYNSFFAVLLFGIATLIVYRRGERRLIKLPVIAVLLVSLSTALNLVPALQSWRHEGTPPEMGYKAVAEAEVYGAKLRRMLSPHPDNPIPPLGKIGRKDLEANFPNENENVTARLGLYGAFGLLVMIAFMLRRAGGAAPSQPMRAVSSLSLATLLLITVGGFGVVINLLTVPDIRAYNRFSVYLSFFAIAATGLWLKERFLAAPSRRLTAWVVLTAGFALLSLYDQLLDAKPMLSLQQENMRRAHADRAAVETLEQYFPADAAILELPLTGYPPLSILHQMQSYDLGRPFLWSHHLKWSWPSFSRRHREWQDKLGALQGADLTRAAIFSGFDAIWIDRAAYDDAGRALIARLSSDKVKPVDIGSARFAVLDLRAAAADLKASMSAAAFRQQAQALLGSGAVAEWKRGFYDEERNAQGRRFRWAQDTARLTLSNPGDTPLRLCVGFEVASQNEGTMQIEGAAAPVSIQVSARPQAVRLPLEIKPGEVRSLHFSTALPRIHAPGDQRDMHFYVMDFDMSTQQPDGQNARSCSIGTKQ